MPSTPPTFLVEHIKNRIQDVERHQPNGLPFITVTWAQSLDFKIAGPGGKRVMISGPESMEMTHWLRTMHNGILIGINTLILDDPRLQIQLVSAHNSNLKPPQPLVLDPKLRFPPTARILQEWITHQHNPSVLIRQPWIICGDSVDVAKREQLQQAGARVIPIPLDREGRIDPKDLLGHIRQLGLKSVMVEGGSRILSAFLAAGIRDDEVTPVVNSVVVTVGPMFIGEGISVVPSDAENVLPTLGDVIHTEVMGKDTVIITRIAKPLDS